MTTNFGEHTEQEITPEFQVFPNPAKDVINVVIPTETEKIITHILIRNNIGVVVDQFKVVEHSSNIRLEIPNLISGIYTLEILENDHPISIQKVVIFK